jgi:hypothetical protein
MVDRRGQPHVSPTVNRGPFAGPFLILTEAIMTKAKSSTVETLYPAPVILFGIDSRGKPKAARFRKDHAGLAVKAASQLRLQVLANDSPKIGEIAARLPVGKVHATGRAFVRRDLYDKLVAAASNGKRQPPTPASATSAASESAPKPSGSTPNLPESWDKIGIGDLVIAQESPDDGWYAAIVLEANGDMLTVRWRDYPRSSRFVRHRRRLGLLYPGQKPGADTQKTAKPMATAKQDNGSPPQTAVASQKLPKHWSEIDIGHLVLAKSDGPWLDYWEATPIEKVGDVLKLRWRDDGDLAPITRSRFELALICPDAS